MTDGLMLITDEKLMIALKYISIPLLIIQLIVLFRLCSYRWGMIWDKRTEREAEIEATILILTLVMDLIIAVLYIGILID